MKLFALILLILPTVVFCQLDTRTVTVYGKAQKEVTPDKALIYVAFSEYEKVKESDLTAREEALSGLLTKWGIPFEDIEVLQMNASRTGYYGSAFSKKIRFAKSFQLEFSQPKRLTYFMIDLFEIGADEVHITDLKYNNMESTKIEVTRLAMENAREKALIMAHSQGDSLGQTISIKEFPTKEYEKEDYSYQYQSYGARLRATGAVSRSIADNAINDGPGGLSKILVEVDVRVVYSLE